MSEILGESAASLKNLPLLQNTIEWPKMIVTDARDVYDKLSTERGGMYFFAAAWSVARLSLFIILFNSI